MAFRGEEGFLIPAEEACGGAKKGEVFASGAEFFIGFRKRRHTGMMKQDGASWNIFLARRKIAHDYQRVLMAEY